jgi:hypothetical protein
MPQIKYKKKLPDLLGSFEEQSYIFFVVSGGVVFIVSITFLEVSVVFIVESVVVVVLSLVSVAFFVELHAEASIIIEPATARLKTVLFIVCFFNVNETIKMHLQHFD